jgi:hypothetical protein
MNRPPYDRKKKSVDAKDSVQRGSRIGAQNSPSSLSLILRTVTASSCSVSRP